MNHLKRVDGYSVLELAVGLGVSAITLAGIMQVMMQVSSMGLASRMQNLVNDTYLLGLHVASHPALFADRGINATPMVIPKPLMECLSQKGTDCTSFTKKSLDVPDQIDKQLNKSFGFTGTCDPKEPTCLVTRTTQYRWECPADTYCTGLRIFLKSTPIVQKSASAQTPIKERSGSVLIPARQFISKAEVSFTCPKTGVGKGIFGIDYTHLTDQASCSTYDPGLVCANPMMIYTNSGGCVPQQTQDCGDGFETVGLFSDQKNCIPAMSFVAAVTPVGPTPVTPVAPTPVGPGPGPVTPPPPAVVTGAWYYQINMGVITQPPSGVSIPCPTPIYLNLPCTNIGATCALAQNIDIAHFSQIWQCYRTNTGEETY